MIRTVLGRIDPGEVRMALTHEHLLFDFTANIRSADEFVSQHEFARKYSGLPSDFDKWDQPLDLLNIREAKEYFHLYGKGLQQLDGAFAAREVKHFADVGGNLIVDATPEGIGRSPQKLRKISEETGVHVVMATGFYTRHFHPSGTAGRSVEELAAQCVNEIEKTSDPDGVPAGIIKLALQSTPHPLEEKCMRAAAAAQAESGAPLLVHPPVGNGGAVRAVTSLLANGANPARIVVCHQGEGYIRGTQTPDQLESLLDLGVSLGIDHFGRDGIHRQIDRRPLSTDLDRIYLVLQLIEQGFAERVFISSDIALGWMRSQLGGPGFQHVPITVVNALRALGATDDNVDLLMRRNPQRLLAF